MGGKPLAAELANACSSLGLGRRRVDIALSAKRGASRKLSKFKSALRGSKLANCAAASMIEFKLCIRGVMMRLMVVLFMR